MRSHCLPSSTSLDVSQSQERTEIEPSDGQDMDSGLKVACAPQRVAGDLTWRGWTSALLERWLWAIRARGRTERLR